MTDAQPIAIARDYLDLIAGLRKRVLELGINYDCLDQLAGWTDSYSSKLLAAEPAKRMGAFTLGTMLNALGVELHLVENAQQTALITSRRAFEKRKIRPMLASGWHDLIVHRKTREDMRQMAIRGGIARMKIPPHKRQQLARRAARVRWRKPRVVEITCASEKAAIYAAHTDRAVAPPSDSRPDRRSQNGAPTRGSRPGKAPQRRGSIPAASKPR